MQRFCGNVAARGQTLPQNEPQWKTPDDRPLRLAVFMAATVPRGTLSRRQMEPVTRGTSKEGSGTTRGKMFHVERNNIFRVKCKPY